MKRIWIANDLSEKGNFMYKSTCRTILWYLLLCLIEVKTFIIYGELLCCISVFDVLPYICKYNH